MSSLSIVRATMIVATAAWAAGEALMKRSPLSDRWARAIWTIGIAFALIHVALAFHLVYAWNDFFGPLIYLSTKPELQPLAVGLQRFNGIHYRNPAYVQAGTLMTMVIPVILFLIFQRVFIRGVVVTGVEK